MYMHRNKGYLGYVGKWRIGINVCNAYASKTDQTIIYSWIGGEYKTAHELYLHVYIMYAYQNGAVYTYMRWIK